MLNITHAEASKNILHAVRTRTLIQASWHTTAADGKAIACLLGSIHPTVTSPEECNGDLMPMWLAELTPTLFDGIPKNNIYSTAERYGTLVAQWHQLTQTQWQTILNKFLVLTIDTALNAARPANIGKSYWNKVETACNQCKEAIINNDKSAYAADADAAVADAAAAAYYAAYAAAAADADAAADYAAYAVARAADRAASCAADAVTYAAAYLSLFTFLLDQIEEECANHD